MKFGHCQDCGAQCELVGAYELKIPTHNFLGRPGSGCSGFAEQPAELSRYYVETIRDMDLRSDADRWRKISAKYFGKPLD